MESTKTDFRLAQITNIGGFELDCSADKAFPMFSPEGERLWVDGWNPKPLFPIGAEIAFATHSVFTLEMGGERSLWQILEVDSDHQRADYLYVVEGSRIVRVQVSVEPLALERCRVRVMYTVTSLTSAGARFLETFTPEAFEEKMKNWRRLVSGAVRTAE